MMKRGIMMKILKSLAAIILTLSILSGCASYKAYDTKSEARTQMGNTNETTAGSMNSTGAGARDLNIGADKSETAVKPEQVKEEGLEEKIIYTGHISVETLDYDKAVSSINARIKELKGFIEGTELSNNGGYDRYDGTKFTGSRRASITARIPKESFEGFMGSIGEYGVVINQSTQAENITAQYNDVSMQLKSLEIQHENLLKMLGKAEKVEDMIKLEESLSDVRWKINSINSQLKNWDTSVDYSTININLEEVKQYSPTEQDGFFTRLFKAVTSGFKDYGQWLQDIIIGITRNILYIVTFVFIIILIQMYTKKMMKKKRALNIKGEKAESKEKADNTTDKK